LKIDVLDVDPNKSDFIGNVTFELGELMGSKHNMLILDLKNDKRKAKAGKVIVRSEAVQEKQDRLNMSMDVNGLDFNNMFSDPGASFISIYKDRGGNVNNQGPRNDYSGMIKVYTTETHPGGKNPKFRNFWMNSSKLCNTNYECPLIVNIYHYKSSGDHKIKGTVQLTMQDVLQNKTFEFINAKRKKKCGTLKINLIKKDPLYTLYDYLKGGLNISLVCCIDFTGSNGDPNQSNSLHAYNPNSMNSYQQAIHSICQILMNYDSDKMVPTYGFGAACFFEQAYPNGFNSHGQASHFFPCSGLWENTEGYGVEGIFQHYNTSIQYVRLSGPTYFAPLLTQVRDFTNKSFQQDKWNYTVLLILTDGAIHDFNQARDAIIDMTNLPISIIIVGIGSAGFGKMDQLDGDDCQ